MEGIISVNVYLFDPTAVLYSQKNRGCTLTKEVVCHGKWSLGAFVRLSQTLSAFPHHVHHKQHYIPDEVEWGSQPNQGVILFVQVVQVELPHFY